MATINTKFNIGETAYFIEVDNDLYDADEDGIDLFNSILNNIRCFKITEIRFAKDINNKDGIKYESDGNRIYYEHQLFKTEKQAYDSAISKLYDHLKNNLKNAENLMKESKDNFEKFKKELEDTW